MKKYKTIKIQCLGKSTAVDLTPFVSHLKRMPHITFVESSDPMDDAHVVITSGVDFPGGIVRLTSFVENGGGWLHVTASDENALPDVFGVQPGPVGPATELRILFTDRDNPMAERLADAFYVSGRFQELLPNSDDVDTVVYADWHFSHRAVLTCRSHGRGRAACTSLQAFDNRDVQRIIYRLCWHMTGRPFGRSLAAGILGYAPSVGRLHGLGCTNTPGLELVAACDLSKPRRDQAGADFDGIRLYDSAGALAADPDVDLVFVATPPNTHTGLSIEMMAAGKHVLCEKPLAINRKETDALIDAMQTHGVHLSCHQNRRFDADYLAIRSVIADGLVGDPFYLETFVGGFSHPCGYWHSDEPISGGTAYDWGAHYLDWIVSLFTGPIASVVGTRHKRVWHDVSNADQERIQIRFRNGSEAEFMHSDIAAFRKPKWYLLGTEGALSGSWQDVSTFTPDDDVYYRRDDIPATEMPRRGHYAFHRNLADHLLLGEPLAAPLDDSVKVVAILEAAARSMAKGGAPEVIDG